MGNQTKNKHLEGKEEKVPGDLENQGEFLLDFDSERFYWIYSDEFTPVPEKEADSEPVSVHAEFAESPELSENVFSESGSNSPKLEEHGDEQHASPLPAGAEVNLENELGDSSSEKSDNDRPEINLGDVLEESLKMSFENVEREETVDLSDDFEKVEKGSD